MKRVALILLIPFLVHSGFARTQQPSLQGDLLELAAREFVDLLVKGEYDKATANFDATMTEVMPSDKLQTAWQGLLTQSGSFESQGVASKQTVGKYEIILVFCEFERMKLNIKVVFDQQKKISGLFFLPVESWKTPSYADKEEFIEADVTVGSDPWQLPGTLTVPKGSGPFPAIVLVHGSGPNDRDETIGPNKVFKDLAWGLASKGIAVLRYDKRTKVHGAKLVSLSEFTVKEETIDDALAAVASLAQHPSIDAKRMFVLGHSLGGYLVPRIAAADQTGSIAGYISLAGSTRPTEDLMLEQTKYLLGLDGSLSESDQEQLTQLGQQVAAIKALTAESVGKSILGAPPSYWLDLRGYSPPQMSKAMSQPLLVLQGERDYQVTTADFANWQQALAGRANVRFKSYPALNHLFIAGVGKSAPVEYLFAGNVAQQVINDVAQWVTGP